MGTQRYLRGLAMANLPSFGGNSGFRNAGSDSVGNHSHGVSVPAHTHSIPNQAEANGFTGTARNLNDTHDGSQAYRGDVVPGHHNHTFSVPAHNHGGNTGSAGSSSGNTSGAGGHSNLPASIEVAFIVRVK